MSLLVTGSIGIDDVRTPHGEVKGVYGGSAVYFSFAARLFAPVRFVGVVGEDFPAEFRSFLEGRSIDLAGLEVRKGSRTFRWAGQYASETADAETTGIELNVLAEAGPRIPNQFRDSRYVFLAATHPELQQDLLRQLSGPRLVMADTRDLWIQTQREGLLKVLKAVTGAILNDAEAKLFADEQNLIAAARKILDYGPRFVVIKKGEHGAMLVTREGLAVLPAYPTMLVRDPTGAGDSFAGGMMGFLATREEHSLTTLKQAMAYGTIAASFTIEDFSLRAIDKLTREQLATRVREYAGMLDLGQCT
ncbi:MAG: sugar kinase [Phycisphaerae bacterium]